MAASSGDDILAQLAALLGRESVCQIRKTATVPPQISVVDVAAAIRGKSHDAAAQDFRRMSKKYPDVSAKCTDVGVPLAHAAEVLRGRVLALPRDRGPQNAIHCDCPTSRDLFFAMNDETEILFSSTVLKDTQGVRDFRVLTNPQSVW